MRKEILLIAFAATVLASCGGSSVKIMSSPMGANISFEGKTETTPFTRYGVASGTYEISGIKTGYIPQKMTINVTDGENQFSMVFPKEAERPSEFATNVPDDGIRIRTNPDARRYEFLPYDPISGKLGKVIKVDGPSEPLFDLKLLRKAGGLENASFIVKVTADGKTCWVDAQPGGDVVANMVDIGSHSKPNWKFPARLNENIKRTDSEVKDGVATLNISGTKVAQLKTETNFQAQTNGNLTVWSAVDSEGVQDLFMVENGTVKKLWHGEFGMGALDYLRSTSSIATTSGGYIFAGLATEEGYRIAAIDKSGKIIDKVKVFDFPNDVSVKKFEGFYGIILTNRKGVIRTFTFDGKTFMPMPEVLNSDFTKSSGVWLRIGNNLELYVNENLSAMCIPEGQKFKVVYVGSRF